MSGGGRFLSPSFFPLALYPSHFLFRPALFQHLWKVCGKRPEELIFPVLVSRSASPTVLPTKTRGNSGWKGPVGLLSVLLPESFLCSAVLSASALPGLNDEGLLLR